MQDLGRLLQDDHVARGAAPSSAPIDATGELIERDIEPSARVVAAERSDPLADAAPWLSME